MWVTRSAQVRARLAGSRCRRVNLAACVVTMQICWFSCDPGYGFNVSSSIAGAGVVPRRRVCGTPVVLVWKQVAGVVRVTRS